MLASSYRERARRLFATEETRAILAERPLLFWRTHDCGLLEFDTTACEEGLRRGILKTLGGNARGPERAVVLLRLFYAPAKGLLTPADCLEDDGGLPGQGCVKRLRDTWLCASRDPEACLARLAELEQRARNGLLDRLTGANAPDSGDDSLASATQAGSCGKCGAGLLGGSGDCLGSACVNNGQP